MAKVHTASDGRVITHQHGDYANAAALAAAIANTKS